MSPSAFTSTESTTTVCGRYGLRELIVRDGLGAVWAAYDELLHREVAVRELCYPPGLTEDECAALAERTLRDAQSVAAIDTPAAVRVFDIAEQDGRPWIVMELVRGRTLTDVVHERGALPSAEAARIGLVLLDALAAAHRAGVVHGDLKPSNVIVGDDGRIALAGFGIATVDASPGESGDGAVVGAPRYLAPERLAGDGATAESDLWSLGATLWTAVAGRPPYDGDDENAVLADIESMPAPECGPCTPQLADILRRLMAADPAERPRPRRVRTVLEAVCRDARAATRRGNRHTAPGRLNPAMDAAKVVSAGSGSRRGRRAGRETDADERTWPLVLAVVAVLLLAMVLLSVMLGGG